MVPEKDWSTGRQCSEKPSIIFRRSKAGKPHRPRRLLGPVNLQLHCALGAPLTNTAALPPAIVLDTNVALDGLLFDDPAMGALMHGLHAGELRWLVTARMREEFRHVLARPVLAKYVADGEHTLSLFDQLAIMREECTLTPTEALRCRDADDQVFIELALRERAPWLVTRDRDLLCLGKRARRLNLAILTPEAWAREFTATVNG